MDNQWSVDTHGDPLGTVQAFLKHVWQAANLDGMLLTLTGDGEAHAHPCYVSEAAAIDRVNPFRPLMEMNAARLIPAMVGGHPDARLGALLRPCELRALVEIAKHIHLDLGRLLTISVDCLGTLPADEYQWRLERIHKCLPTTETPDDLAQEALQFARQGGIIPYRFRSACQVCASPAAHDADINLHVLGLPVRQQFLVSVTNDNIAQSIGLRGYASKIIDENLLLQHERVLAKMGERHQKTMERLTQGLGSLLPADVDAVIHQLEACGDCQRCLDACPICSVDRPRRDDSGHYERSSVMHWLVSCAGCGMCEQACPQSLPVAAIFAHIRRQLDQQRDYVPGRSVNDPLPAL